MWATKPAPTMPTRTRGRVAIAISLLPALSAPAVATSRAAPRPRPARRARWSSARAGRPPPGPERPQGERPAHRPHPERGHEEAEALGAQAEHGTHHQGDVDREVEHAEAHHERETERQQHLARAPHVADADQDLLGHALAGARLREPAGPQGEHDGDRNGEADRVEREGG